MNVLSTAPLGHDLEHSPFRGLDAGGLEDGHLIAVIVGDGCTVGTLIEDCLVARQIPQLLGLPG